MSVRRAFRVSVFLLAVSSVVVHPVRAAAQDAGAIDASTVDDGGASDAAVDAGNVPPPPPPGPKTPGKPVTPVDNGCSLSVTTAHASWPALGFLGVALWLSRRRRAQAVARA